MGALKAGLQEIGGPEMRIAFLLNARFKPAELEPPLKE